MSGYDLHLPSEISTEILTKLPVKSLVRFRCGCKTWYSLISSPDFVSAQTLNQSKRVLLHRCDPTDINHLGRFSSHDDSFVESHELNELPNPFRSSGVTIAGSCEGLVALFKQDWDNYTDTPDNFLIWNPSLRKLVLLRPRLSPFFGRVSHLLGFGFDSGSSDYKVVRVVFEYYNVFHDSNPLESEILDMSKGVWRSLIPPWRPMRVSYLPCSGLYLNGSLHWIGNEGSSNCFLLTFNLSSEVFQEMEVPLDAEFYEVNDYDRYTKLSQIKGLLSLAVFKDKRDGVCCCCSVWSMKDYGVSESWTRLFNIVLPFHLDSPLLFLDNNEVLILDRCAGSNDNNVLVLYNPESETSVALLSTNESILKACLYEESLVLL